MSVLLINLKIVLSYFWSLILVDSTFHKPKGLIKIHLFSHNSESPIIMILLLVFLQGTVVSSLAFEGPSYSPPFFLFLSLKPQGLFLLWGHQNSKFLHHKISSTSKIFSVSLTHWPCCPICPTYEVCFHCPFVLYILFYLNWQIQVSSYQLTCGHSLLQSFVFSYELHCKCFSGCCFQISHKLCILPLQTPLCLNFYFLCNHQRKVFIYSFSGSKIDQILDFWLKAKFVQSSPHPSPGKLLLVLPVHWFKSNCFLKLGSLIFFLQSLFIQQEAITHNEKALGMHTLQLQLFKRQSFHSSQLSTHCLQKADTVG